jgi:hypothetical protein
MYSTTSWKREIQNTKKYRKGGKMWSEKAGYSLATPKYAFLNTCNWILPRWNELMKWIMQINEAMTSEKLQVSGTSDQNNGYVPNYKKMVVVVFFVGIYGRSYESRMRNVKQ